MPLDFAESTSPTATTEAEPELAHPGERCLTSTVERLPPPRASGRGTTTGRMMRRFLRFFGRHRKAETLSQRDWDRFIRARRAGKAGGSRRPVSERTIEYDLRLLLAVLNWAAKSRDEEGTAPPRIQPAPGPQAAEGEESETRGAHPDGVRSVARGVRTGGLAVPSGLGARPRDRAPDRCHSAASVGRHRPRWPDHPVAGRAREDRLRAPDAGHRRGARRLGGGAEA